MIRNLNGQIANVRHVILYADRNTLIDRINNDVGRDKELALNSIDDNEKYYEGIFEKSIKIDTTELSLEETAKKILELVQ